MKKTAMLSLAIMMSATSLYAGNGDLIVDGKLGVGTSSLSSKLQISFDGNDLKDTLYSRNSDAGASAANRLAFGNNVSQLIGTLTIYGGNHAAKPNYLILNNEVAAPLIFGTNGEERVRVDSSGNVGIGTTSPLSRVHTKQPALTITGLANAVANSSAFFEGNSPSHASWGLSLGYDNSGFMLLQGVDRGQTAARNFLINPYGGNIGIGTTNLGAGGSGALIFGEGSKPNGLTGVGAIYAINETRGGTTATALYACDGFGNQSIITPHAIDAPDWMYDLDDGLPIMVKEIQEFLGYVRYTNQTRQARLVSMTDAEKSSLSPQLRTCVYTESFADHNNRLGLSGADALVKLDWYAEQQAIKSNREAEILAAQKIKADLQAAIASAQDENTRAELVKQEASFKVPAEYIVKDPPERLRAALNAAK